MTTSPPKKLVKSEAMRCAAVQGRRFMTDHPHGAVETLILDMAYAAERATLTIPNWWAAYAVSAGIYHSLIKSTPEERRGFCDWLEAQVSRRPSVSFEKPRWRPRRFISDEQKAERQAERKAKQRLRKQQTNLVKRLDALELQYGRGPVAAWLTAWMNGPETPGSTLVGE